MQRLLEEVAFKVREFYDSHGCNLEDTSNSIIDIVTNHLNSIAKVEYEEVTPTKPVKEGECILIHSLRLNKPVIFGTILGISGSEWKLAGRTYSTLADPQIFDLDISLYGKDWIAYRIFLKPNLP